MITKEKILEILEQNSILSRTEGRVVIYENDWENIEEEIVKNCSIPDVRCSLPIEFLEWTEKHMWSKWESRNDGYHEMEGWYNTHNYNAMKQPLTTLQLFELFMTERRRQ